MMPHSSFLLVPAILRPPSVSWYSRAVWPNTAAPAPTTYQSVYLTFAFSEGSPASVRCTYAGTGATLPLQSCTRPSRISSDGAFDRPVSSVTATWTQGPTPQPYPNANVWV
jgi:hypothetical protein